GVQQWLVDGITASNALSLLSQPNTWTQLQTFSGGISVPGGSFTFNNLTTSNIDNIIYIDGVVNTLPTAISSAPTNSLIIVPPGNFNITSNITIAQNNVHVQCAGINATKINYTGAGPVYAVIDIGTADNGSVTFHNISVNGCTLSGNANTNYALRLRGVFRSDFSNNSLINATIAGMLADFVVADNFNGLHTSSNEQAFTVQPVNCIIGTGPDNSHVFSTSTMEGDICEGVSGDGWQIGY